MDIKFINSVAALAGLRVSIGIFNEAAYVCADQAAVSSAHIRVALFSDELPQVVKLSSVALYFDNGIRYRLAVRQSNSYLNYIARSL